MALRVLSEAEIIKLFGDPHEFMHDDGTIGPGWEQKILDYCPLPAPLPLSWDTSVRVNKFRCHKKLVKPFKAVFEELFNYPDAWKSINDFGGCYEWRRQRNAKSLSRHSFGAAIDIDVRDNPMGDTTPMVSPMTVSIFAAHGFAWGGYFKPPRTDAEHFEFAGDPALVA